MAARHQHEYEDELELEDEMEGEFEGELEGEFEDEMEGEFEDEMEGELEGEQFFRRFRRIARGVGGFVRRAAPILRSVARVAAPLVGTAVGGPLGGMIGRVAAQALREEELEDEAELEDETEAETEDEYEGEGEDEAEFMAAVAARAQTEDEAEAMVGAAAARILSRGDRQALRRMLPHLVRGVAVLTRVLRRRRVTRPAVRAVPAIVRRTVRTLARRAATGRPVTRATAGRVMAAQTRRVLGNPRTCARAIQRNVRATARTARQTTAREFEI
jgi:hypothetical protein